MLKELKENVWDIADSNSIICVLTNNGVINLNEDYNEPYWYNHMGGGIAGEANRRNLGLANKCGQAIKENKYDLGLDKLTLARLIRFPTMQDIGYQASLKLIEQSLKVLAHIIAENKDKLIYLPRPGCGIGGLDWNKQVKPLCEKYLGNYDNVYVIYK